MQILAASVMNAANTFLHAGYISAAPVQHGPLSCAPVPGAMYDADVLREGSISFAAPAASMVTDSGNPLTLVIGVVCFVLGLAGLYLFRQLRARTQQAPG